MISAEFGRYLNTIFGIVKNGEYLCLRCGDTERDDLLHNRASDDVCALSGLDFYNAGESENAVECGECTWSGDEDDVDPYHLREHPGCEGVPSLRYICDECGNPLRDGKEA